MSNDEFRQALDAYALAGGRLNQELRAGRVPALARVLDRAILQAGVRSMATVVWRGVGDRECERRQPPFRRNERGFLSVSDRESIARFFAGRTGTLFRLEVPADVPLLVVRDVIEPAYPLEFEMLLPRGMTITVTSVQTSEDLLLAQGRIEVT